MNEIIKNPLRLTQTPHITLGNRQLIKHSFILIYFLFKYFFVQQQMGYDRVMYAMDYPYQYVAEEVTAMDNLPLSDEQKKMFFQTNAERIFKL